MTPPPQRLPTVRSTTSSPTRGPSRRPCPGGSRPARPDAVRRRVAPCRTAPPCSRSAATRAARPSSSAGPCAPGGRVVRVDPFVDGRLFGGASTRAKFERNVDDAGHRGRGRLQAEFSTRAAAAWSARFDLLYIDGKHDYWTFTDDLRWAAFLPRGRSSCTTRSRRSGSRSGCWPRCCRPRRCATTRSDSMALFAKEAPARRRPARILAEMPVVDPQRRDQGAAAPAPAPGRRRSATTRRTTRTERPVSRSAARRRGRSRVGRPVASASTSGSPAARPTRTSPPRAGS